MIALCEMISSLRQSEIRALRAQYSLRERNEQDLRGKLLDLVLDKKEVTDEVASRHIYNTRPGSAFSHLKNRLWEDICNVLALQAGGIDTEAYPVRARVSQLVNVARVLKNRQLYKQSFEMSREALTLSLRHSLVPELMLLKDFISLTFPDYWMKERTKVLSVLSESVRQEADRLRAASLAELLRDGNYSTSHVAELESLYRSSSCQQIRSIVHRSMINIYLQTNDKEKLMNECIQLYSLALELSSDPEQKKRNAIAFTDITKAALHVRSYDSAIAFGKAGLEFVEDDLILRIEAYENLLIAYFNTGQFSEAEEIIHVVDDYFSRLNQLEYKKHFHYYL